MNKKETEIVSNSPDNDQMVISTGKWNENISWKFIISPIIPDEALCTAVCCITTVDRKLVLIRNKRGWELPAGHREDETIKEAIVREVREEAGVAIVDPRFFGYKKLTAKKPIPKKGSTSDFYPFPTSYVSFFYAEGMVTSKTIYPDVSETILATYSQAKMLLEENGQYTNILEYLKTENLIQVDD